jgi:hypothetical protein
MESLVLIEDPFVRDMIVVGLRNIPGCRAESPSGIPDVGRAKRRAFDTVFIDHDPNRGSSVGRLNKLREIAPTAEIVVVAEERVVKSLSGERARLNLSAFVELPINVREFFKLGVRLRRRSDSRKAHK